MVDDDPVDDCNHTETGAKYSLIAWPTMPYIHILHKNHSWINLCEILQRHPVNCCCKGGLSKGMFSYNI